MGFQCRFGGANQKTLKGRICLSFYCNFRAACGAHVSRHPARVFFQAKSAVGGHSLLERVLSSAFKLVRRCRRGLDNACGCDGRCGLDRRFAK
jgi:hypothetical protein